jgi:hypothetical protein
MSLCTQNWHTPQDLGTRVPVIAGATSAQQVGDLLYSLKWQVQASLTGDPTAPSINASPAVWRTAELNFKQRKNQRAVVAAAVGLSLVQQLVVRPVDQAVALELPSACVLTHPGPAAGATKHREGLRGLFKVAALEDPSRNWSFRALSKQVTCPLHALLRHVFTRYLPMLTALLPIDAAAGWELHS